MNLVIPSVGTAAELVLELVTRKLKAEKIGAHIAEEKARIDFFHEQLHPDSGVSWNMPLALRNSAHALCHGIWRCLPARRWRVFNFSWILVAFGISR